MACGCACVASRVGGNAELIEPGRTGLLFEKGDVRGLAAQIERLLRDPNLRQQLGRRAATSIRTRFSLEAAALRLGSIYREVLEVKASR